MNSSYRLALIATIAACVSLLVPQEARACTCVEEPPPCEAYWQSTAVFDGVVLEQEPVVEPIDKEGPSAGHAYLRVKMSVKTAYRGVSGGEVILHTGLGAGDCGYQFRKGERYLVYADANKDGTVLGTSICSRTRLLAEAGEDLAFIRSISSAPTGGRLFGSVKEIGYERGSRYGENEIRGLGGATVDASDGARSYTATTNAEGAFEITGLPTGTYEVTLRPPRGYQEPYSRFEENEATTVEVDERGCAQASLTAGRVSLRGLVLDDAGTPGSTDVSLVDPDDPRVFFRADTRDDGRFEFLGVPPGRYLLVHAYDRHPTPNFPFRTSYYPGSIDRSQARVLTISDRGAAQSVEMRLPPRERPVLVHGVVQWPDGKPAVTARVSIEVPFSSNSSLNESAEVDAQGRFSFEAFAGERYRVFAHFSYGKDGMIRSESAEVAATEGDGAPVRLVLGVAPSPE